MAEVEPRCHTLRMLVRPIPCDIWVTGMVHVVQNRPRRVVMTMCILTLKDFGTVV